MIWEVYHQYPIRSSKCLMEYRAVENYCTYHDKIIHYMVTVPIKDYSSMRNAM
jgi:hypothetical protein